MDIELNFTNAGWRYDGAVVLFQPNAAASPQAPATAWKVIRHCEPGWTHPFVYPTEIELGLGDIDGNYSPRTPAAPGDRFGILDDADARRLAFSGADRSAREIVVRNEMPRGALNVCAYRARRLLAVRPHVAPGQLASFRFDPLLWIACLAAANDGDAIDPSQLGDDRAGLPLFGVARADIVMTGGGPGPTAAPVRFHLANIAMA
jgi:hypothetical protein